MGVPDIVINSPKTVEDWKLVLKDLNDEARQVREQLNQLNGLRQYLQREIDHSASLASTDLLTLRKLPRVHRKRRLIGRTPRGFEFYDRLMRQAPSPGTIRQRVPE